MYSKTFEILALSAWAPSLLTRAQWVSCLDLSPGNEPKIQQQQLPEMSVCLSAPFVPAMVRRRCSNLTRASLSVAHSCLKRAKSTQVASIFASRHGEAEITAKSLVELANLQPLSPNDFSLSVHNTSSGLFSIVEKSIAASTAIAAGSNTLDAAFLEVLNAFNENSGNEEVLLVVSDMPCPAIFEEVKPNPSFAFALLLGLNGFPGRPTLTIKHRSNPQRTPMSPSHTGSGGIELFLHWLICADVIKPLSLVESIWHFEKSGIVLDSFMEIEGQEKQA